MAGRIYSKIKNNCSDTTAFLPWRRKFRAGPGYKTQKAKGTCLNHCRIRGGESVKKSDKTFTICLHPGKEW